WEGLAGRPGPFSRTLEIPSIEPAADGFVGFCTITAQQWRDFLVLIERPDLVDDETLARWDERVRRVHDVNAMIHRWTRPRAVAEIVERAAALRIPLPPIGTPRTLTRFEPVIPPGLLRTHPPPSVVP